MIRRALHRKYAFTLVELLVVVGIIGLLLAILLPSLASAKRDSLAVSCGANMHGIGQAMNNYLNDNQNRFPYSGFQSATVPGVSYDDLLDNYIGGNTDDPTKQLDGTPGNLKMLICPADPRLNVVTLTNGMRSYSMSQGVSPIVSTPNMPGFNTPITVNALCVPNPSYRVLLVENPYSPTTGLGPLGNVCNQRGMWEQAAVSMPYFQSWSVLQISYGNPISPNAKNVASHPSDTFNYLYMDAHVERMYPRTSDTRLQAGATISGTYSNSQWCASSNGSPLIPSVATNPWYRSAESGPWWRGF